jgi:hypothetical protein
MVEVVGMAGANSAPLEESGYSSRRSDLAGMGTEGVHV